MYTMFLYACPISPPPRPHSAQPSADYATAPSQPPRQVIPKSHFVGLKFKGIFLLYGYGNGKRAKSHRQTQPNVRGTVSLSTA